MFLLRDLFHVEKVYHQQEAPSYQEKPGLGKQTCQPCLVSSSETNKLVIMAIVDISLQARLIPHLWRSCMPDMDATTVITQISCVYNLN